jgi:hypothetical protein
MFDSTQVHLLQAMGFELWQRRDTVSATPAATLDSSPPSSSPVPPPPSPAGMQAAPPLPRAPDAPVAAIAPDAARAPGGLWGAVLAAAGLDEAGADRARVRQACTGVAVAFRGDELWIDPQGLRGDARAKRMLWKTLRALRRAELGRRG